MTKWTNLTENGSSEYIQMAKSEYDSPIETYREQAIEALESLDSQPEATAD